MFKSPNKLTEVYTICIRCGNGYQILPRTSQRACKNFACNDCRDILHTYKTLLSLQYVLNNDLINDKVTPYLKDKISKYHNMLNDLEEKNNFKDNWARPHISHAENTYCTSNTPHLSSDDCILFANATLRAAREIELLLAKRYDIESDDIIANIKVK